jgi:RNA polymerase-binding transcription factor DksA
MTEQEIGTFKQRLLDERQRILSDRAPYRAEDRVATIADEFNESADYDPNDPADEGADLYDRDRSEAAEQNMDRILAKIDRALAKIDEGTYGLSDVDGTPIPVERLEALPYALATVEQEQSL